MNRIGLKDVADITFFDIITREIVVFNEETKEWDKTGKFVPEPEGEIVYSTEDEDDDYDSWFDDRLDCGCCSCCGCSCYYDDDDYYSEESDTDE